MEAVGDAHLGVGCEQLDRDSCGNKSVRVDQPNNKLRDAAPALSRPLPASEGKDLTP